MLLKLLWPFVMNMIHLYAAQQYHNVIGDQQMNIRMSIDNTINPCDDFYAFACGNYGTNNDDPNYQEITSLMDYKYNKQLLFLIDTMYQDDYQIPSHVQTIVEKTKIYLKACLYETKRNVTKYFDEIKPGAQLNWPLLGPKWPADNAFDVWPLLGRLQSYGLQNVLINQEILVNEDSSFNIILEPQYAENNTTLPDMQILHVLLLGLGIQKPKNVIRHLQNINKNLLDVLDNFASDEKNLLLTYSDLSALYPQLNLSLYLSELLSRDLPLDTPIVIRNSLFFQHLNDHMWQVFNTEKLCNYLMMKFLVYLAMDSTSGFSRLDCIKDLRNKMDVAVNLLYHENILSHQYKEISADVNRIKNKIHQQFDIYFGINRLNLTNTQVQRLKQKLSNVRFKIGNLPPHATYQTIENFYDGLPPLDRYNYYKNHLFLLKHRFSKFLFYKQNLTHFIMPDNILGSSSGAFYVAKQNMIIITLSSLQFPLYDVKYSDVYKYSLLGFVLAHEYAHAFDTTGLNFDSHGNDLPNDSEILDNEKFINAVECLQAQLPTDSIDERIADIVAMSVVYDAYISGFNNRRPPFVEWNREFFLNTAQFFCGKKDVQFLDHDTDSERLNQIAINSQAFATAFKCLVGSKMNPREKCHVY